jgi:hypothetical protein
VSNQPRGGRGTAPAVGRATKAERKEQARLERDAIQRKMARKRRTRTLVIGCLIGLIAIGVGAAVFTSMGDEEGPTASELPGMMTSTAPWSENTAQLAERLEILALPGLSETILHRHTRLEIFVNGDPVVVPANIGIDPVRQVFSPLHTHRTDGLIHTESDDPNFTTDLGTVFDVWGLRLTADCLGAYCAEGDEQVRVFVDGKQVEGDPRAVPLDDLATIVVTYGSEDELPDPIPDSFTA